LQDAEAILKGYLWLLALNAAGAGKVLEIVFGAIGWIAGQCLRAVARGISIAEPALGEVAKAAVQLLWGVNVPASAFATVINSGARENAKAQVGAAMFQAVTGAAGGGGGGTPGPSIEPANRYLGTVAGFAIEGWLIGVLTELESLNYLEH